MPRKNKIVLVVGQKGSGKSSLVRRLVAEMQRAVVLDPMAEYSDGIVFECYADLHTFLRERHAGQWRCICRFQDDGEYAEAVALALEVGACTVVVEEMNFFLSVQSAPDPFVRLFRYGRHRSVSIVAVAQRCAEIPRLFTAQADVVYSFRQVEPRDIEYLGKLGAVGSREAAERCRALPKAERGVVGPEHYIEFR